MDRNRPDAPAGRVAIVGIGNELGGDDAAGAHTIRRLKPAIGARSDVLIVEGGTAPENVTGALRRFEPQTVVLVDAADFSDTPGAVEWVGWEDADGLSASTHTLPPTLLSRYLVSELRCRVLLLAIQPATLEFGAPLSPRVEAAVEEAVRRLTAWIAAPQPA